MEQTILIVAISIMVIGAVVSIIPVIPGIPIIFLTMISFGWLEGFRLISPSFLLIMLLITVLSLFIDNLAGWLGAKKYGASKAGIWGGIIGGFAGVFINPIIGIILGPFIGAIIAEILVDKKNFYIALKIGIGTIIGYFSGGLLRIMLGFSMIAAFLIRVY